MKWYLLCALMPLGAVLCQLGKLCFPAAFEVLTVLGLVYTVFQVGCLVAVVVNRHNLW